ncbi:3-oxoacyl-[acyl-carrier-protein] synthase II [Oceanococcus atlanticus]|uniref:3-oxoacyl-[acyl-carrier-protein] synthase 2 n=1 Tax=Oceanococcus atlanticus TaxID=1317117 RepID=A0A1Y1SDI6_9GAMM|nr:beta-ketoacyl-ACP synthase II [Oceanococcus atlanticus]ORE86254.1 3-oxoacyl-[acyl-carrier-protein] synthase II [Oceanococcus atlanticus]
MPKRRVVVTGLGAVSPVGLSAQESWNSVKAGRSGIGPIDTYDVSAYPTRIAGLVRGFDIEQYMSPKEARKCDPFIHYGIAASDEALKDAALDLQSADLDRIGVHVGSGIGGIGNIEKNHQVLLDKGVRKVSPFFVPSSIINMISGNISIRHGLTGPNLATVTACTTATHCIGLSARLIAHGDADVMIAGGAEAGSSPLGMAGFCAARALSQRNDAPAAASRPWDQDRDGFVLGDGAGVLVLEEYEHAKARGAKIYAELTGFGMSGDAYHITSPLEDGRGAYKCMENALRDADLGIEDVQYINAHGTSTQAGDVAESKAIRRTFGAHADSLAVSSTKSMTGHLLGAAGGLEAVLCLLAMRDGVIPPTINLDQPGEGCDLDYVPNTAREAKLDVVLSNSFGFGGTNGTLIFQRA